MILKSIKIQNFYSIQSLELDLSQLNGIVLIEGKNKDIGNGSNGVGKSTILEAIVWGLFGRTIRKSTEEALVNNKAKKSCLVSLEFSNGATISRTKRPTFLSFYLHDKDITKESVQATQQAIEEFFNINYKTFIVSHLFGQQNEIDFISASAEDKRVIIKNFLSLDDLFKYREKIKDWKSETSANLRAKDSVYQEYNKNIEKLAKDIKDLEKKQEDILTKLNLTQDLSLDEILRREEKFRITKEDRDFLREECMNYDSIITQHKSDLATKIKNKTNICKECGTNYGKVTTEDLKILQHNLSELQEIRANSWDKCTKLTANLNLIKIPISSAEYSRLNIGEGQAKIKLLSNLHDDYNEKLRAIHSERGVLTKKLDILKFWETVFSEQGIMKYIIRNIIDYFNERCMYYLSYLTNGKLKINFDDTLAETITINNIVTNYHSLSGGEKKKINLAVLLALQGLLSFTPKSKFDLLMLDEVVESIDEESINGLHNLLLELSKNKLILIITHNTVLKDLLADRPRIQLVKKNGITKLV